MDIFLRVNSFRWGEEAFLVFWGDQMKVVFGPTDLLEILCFKMTME